MAIDTAPLDGHDTRGARRSCLAPLAVLAGVLAMAASGSLLRNAHPPAGMSSQFDAAVTQSGLPSEAPRAEAGAEAVPSDTFASIGPGSAEPWRDATGGALSRWAWRQGDAPSQIPDPLPDTANAEPPRAIVTVPLPLPRPPEFRAAPGGNAAARGRAERRLARREPAPSSTPAPATDERSFLEKLFGVEGTPALAYAALENKPADLVPQRRLSPPLNLSREPGPTAGTAVYNIITRTVTLPNGERLEAHSGLGEGLDDPRLVNVRMRGPTPPGTYDLTEREQLFHGVRAIRLTPVGGADTIYGRVGLLAHTFMLGPRGDSNGCVSFRDYDRFLQAYLRGEVQRLVVVTGTQDILPSLAEGSAGTRMARNGG